MRIEKVLFHPLTPEDIRDFMLQYRMSFERRAIQSLFSVPEEKSRETTSG